MSTSEKVHLFNYLSNPEVRSLFVSDQIREQIALQIRTMREKRGWTQTELGNEAGIPQPRISLLEDPDYSGLTLATLTKIAKAFDVGLIVRFSPFSELIDWITDLKPENLAPPSYDQERQMSLAEVHGASPEWEMTMTAPRGTVFVLDASAFLTVGRPGIMPFGKVIDSTSDELAIRPFERAEAGERRRELAAAAD